MKVINKHKKQKNYTKNNDYDYAKIKLPYRLIKLFIKEACKKDDYERGEAKID